MGLNDLKQQFENIDTMELDNYSCTEVANMYLSNSYTIDQNKFISYLICNTWNLLQKIFYTNNNNVLSEEDCYDIFIQALHYVLHTHPWTNEKSTLYNDEKAFEKAMAITVSSRRKNFLKAKFRQKRIINSTNFSLDSLEEDFTDGYFSSQEDTVLEDSKKPDTTKLIEDEIKKYCEYGLYLTALILESIIHGNTYNDDGEFDERRLRKILRNLSPEFKLYFVQKYGCDAEDFANNTNYSEMSFNDLDTKIWNSFTTLKHSDIIKTISDKKRRGKR